MKGSDQPIWLLVALLLALVVGVVMYGLVNKVNPEQTLQLLEGVSADQASLGLLNYCQTFRNSNWVMDQEKQAEMAVYARKNNWLTDQEFRSASCSLRYSVSGKSAENICFFTPCDCIVYLYAGQAGIAKITLNDAIIEYSKYNTGITACHSQALTIAKSSGIVK